KLDYKHWLKFYDEGVSNKYPKLATADYHGDNGYVLPLAELPRPIKDKEDVVEPKVDMAQVRDSIEMHRRRILGRLSSAEKLLCSLDGQSFAGDEQEFMLKLLQDLKRKVQTANKISIQSSLFEDFIYRAANYMGSRGSNKGKAFFHKVAQMDPFAGAMPPQDITPTSPSVIETTGGPVEDTRKAFREMKEMSDNLNQSGVLFYDSDDDPDERAKIKKEREMLSNQQMKNKPAPQAIVDNVGIPPEPPI